ncbi:sensor domain-containing diguanylate cyclase [Marinobacter sp.]|uniref:sensor domain-containing diguanylate cyclase n=1 Tax=Marinobacter sp. TaxID=50741 RepID=UPI000C55BDA9|nr:sensor domain-containing diguanylate cyclase [Marinobacter sp.]MBE94687.1 sensor domain-containing diguanylate cyclase [Marinobacter sp.]MBP54438.1 sensor domain-containing diguanylate cyclase [Marinobacter sp.]
MDRLQGRPKPLRRSLWVVGTYLLLGWLWITFSDYLVQQWFPDPEVLGRVQTYKGLLFVLVTGLALFLLLIQQFTNDRKLLSLYRHQREENRELSQFRESVIERANVWINVLDTEGRVVLWNKAAEDISGYPREAVIGSDEIWQLLYPDEENRIRIRERANEILRDEGEVVGYETWITTRDGRERQLSWNSRSLRNEADELAGSIAIGQDITDIRRAETMARQRERQLATILDSLPGMAYRCLYDEHWTLLSASKGCRELTGYEPDELINNKVISFAELIAEDVDEAMLQVVDLAVGNAELFSIEYPLVRKDGKQIWVWECGRSVEGEGELVLEGIVLDISDRKALENELSEMAARDALTGLLNRREMTRLLDEEIVRATRYGRNLALLWIDFDHFKNINDVYGHAAGDSVLKAVSALLAESVRSVDSVGRFGGEEFIVLLPEMEYREALDTAERLRRLVSDAPQSLGNGNTVALTVSIGVSVFPDHGVGVDTLCEAADRAMYQAKADGRNQVVLAPLTEEAHNP